MSIFLNPPLRTRPTEPGLGDGHLGKDEFTNHEFFSNASGKRGALISLGGEGEAPGDGLRKEIFVASSVC